MNSFNRILKNEKYIGAFQYQDIVIPGGVPAAVSEDLFYRVQERLEKNKRAPAMAKADAIICSPQNFSAECASG